MKKFFADFRKFINKGNIVDMAVGVVVGGAFGKIVTSLVADIITPLISLITGKVMLKDLKWVIKDAVLDATGAVVTPESSLTYGNFIQSVIDFLIIALSVFIALRLLMRAEKRLESLKHTAPEAAAAPTTKTCPYCKSEIAVDATRCPHCTSEL